VVIDEEARRIEVVVPDDQLARDRSPGTECASGVLADGFGHQTS